jgi:hypothetical protein
LIADRLWPWERIAAVSAKPEVFPEAMPADSRGGLPANPRRRVPEPEGARR